MKLEVSPKSTEVTLNWKEAKFYCQMLTIDNKTDWRLPTKEELRYLFYNREQYDFKEYFYWSSTELDDNRAWCQYFMDGYMFDVTKKNRNHVIAVRNV